MTQQSRKPRIYLAGKISQSGWRDALLGGKCGYGAGDAKFAVDARGRKTELRDPRHEVDAGDFVYVGPFFEDCQHGCAHGPGSHGVVESYADGEGPLTLGRRRRAGTILEVEKKRAFTFYNAMGAIERADAVFAYINETDCPGTLVELGHAFALAKPIFICHGPKLTAAEKDDLWFAFQTASAVTELPVDVAFNGLIAGIVDFGAGN